MEPSRLAKIKANLKRRARIYNSIRAFFTGEGFLEVETPVRMSAIIPEKYIQPFHFDGCYLSTSPEIYMKQLLAAGYEKIFQICHCFRKGEQGKQHQPEFTMLEWYRTGADYLRIIEDTERLVFSLAFELNPGPYINYRGIEIDVTPPWPKITVREAFKAAGWDPVNNPDPDRFDIDLMEKVVPRFAPDRPTVICDYPAALASLSRLKMEDSQVAERAEVFIGGLEIANGYSELNDVAEQEKRFRLEIEEMKRQGMTGVAIPDEFLKAVAHLPKCAGIALGIDRLIMLFCDAESIDDVIAFPTQTA